MIEIVMFFLGLVNPLRNHLVNEAEISRHIALKTICMQGVYSLTKGYNVQIGYGYLTKRDDKQSYLGTGGVVWVGIFKSSIIGSISNIKACILKKLLLICSKQLCLETKVTYQLNRLSWQVTQYKYTFNAFR